jgi:hypothetical protein
MDIGGDTRDLYIEPCNLLPGSFHFEVLVHKDPRSRFGPYPKDVRASVAEEVKISAKGIFHHVIP